MFKIAVCDDDFEFRKKEVQAIHKIMKRDYSDIAIEVVGFKSGQALLDCFVDQEIDIIFLDIELGLEDGFDIARNLVNIRKNTKIVFVTSHENLVFESFVCRPIGFIRKRIFEQELELIMDQTMSGLKENRIIIEIGEGKSTYRLLVNSIRVVDTYKHKIIVSMETKTIEIRDKVSRFENNLLDCGFVKASRGCAVNMKYISQMENGQISMFDGTKIIISRSRWSVADESYKNYIASH